MEDVLLSDELKMMRTMVKRFIEKDVVKAEQDVGSLAQEFPKDKSKRLQEIAKQMGLWMMGAKKEWGGAELDLFSRVVLAEEAAQHRFGFLQPGCGAFGRDLPVFLQNASPDLTDRVIKPAVRSGNGCFIAMTEPNGGSKLNHLTTTAVRSGDKWKINGVKRFVINVEEADFGIILVNCLDHSDTQQPTLFIIPGNVSLNSKEVKVIRTIKTCDIVFDDFEADEQWRVGNIGEGLQLIQQWMNEEQILMSARCLGIAKKAIVMAVEWATARTTFGKKLSERQAIQWMIADSEIELNAARYMVWSAARQADQKLRTDHEASMAKLLATETAFRVIDRCIQIHGGMGVAQEMPLERWYREIRTSRLDLMPSEVIRESIALEIFKRHKGAVS